MIKAIIAIIKIVYLIVVLIYGWSFYMDKKSIYKKEREPKIRDIFDGITMLIMLIVLAL